MKQLFLHIGTHKTGTTSFQACLLANREALLKAGVALYTELENGQPIANCVQLANAVLRPSLGTPVRMSGYVKPAGFLQYSKSLALLRRFLNTPGAERFLISAEAFCFARTPEEMRKIKGLFQVGKIAVTPVLCVRGESGWRESWEAHLDRWQSSFRRGYGTGTDDIRGDWYFDTDEITRFWKEIGDLRVVDYEVAMAEKGSVIPALLEAMEVGIDAQATDLFLNKHS